MTRIRYVLLVLAIMISLHYILSCSHEGYREAISFKSITGQFLQAEAPYKTPVPEDYIHLEKQVDSSQKKARANATFVVLARNIDLQGVISSMRQMEDRFNKDFEYPWVFLNEEPFSDEFKRRTREITNSQVSYGLISRDHWYQPDSIDEEKATAAREQMVKNNVNYGGSVSYRNMCRFNSGFFFRHELLQNYRYYWRVEPGVNFYCDLHDDPFVTMEENNKVYGFTMSMYEYEATITTLWKAVREFLNENPGLTPENNALAFLSDDGGESYNLCHFWSNFEIGDLDFWRGETYMKFFNFLDKKGGFYYERWGDAPIHSIAAALFARKDQLHFFDDIGYYHDPFQHCPQGDAHSRGKCWCDPNDNFDYHWYSCMKRWDALF